MRKRSHKRTIMTKRITDFRNRVSLFVIIRYNNTVFRRSGICSADKLICYILFKLNYCAESIWCSVGGWIIIFISNGISRSITYHTIRINDFLRICVRWKNKCWCSLRSKLQNNMIARIVNCYLWALIKRQDIAIIRKRRKINAKSGADKVPFDKICKSFRWALKRMDSIR